MLASSDARSRRTRGLSVTASRYVPLRCGFLVGFEQDQNDGSLLPERHEDLRQLVSHMLPIVEESLEGHALARSREMPTDRTGAAHVRCGGPSHADGRRVPQSSSGDCAASAQTGAGAQDAMAIPALPAIDA